MMTKAPVEKRKDPRLAVIEKDNTYTQFIGKFRNIKVQSSFPLSKPDLEAFRINPVGYMAWCNTLEDDTA
jgi:hypothetical protein